MKIIIENDEITGVSHMKPCGLLCDLSAIVAVISLFAASFYGWVWFGLLKVVHTGWYRATWKDRIPSVRHPSSFEGHVSKACDIFLSPLLLCCPVETLVDSHLWHSPNHTSAVQVDRQVAPIATVFYVIAFALTIGPLLPF